MKFSSNYNFPLHLLQWWREVAHLPGLVQSPSNLVNKKSVTTKTYFCVPHLLTILLICRGRPRAPCFSCPASWLALVLGILLGPGPKLPSPSTLSVSFPPWMTSRPFFLADASSSFFFLSATSSDTISDTRQCKC